MMFMNPHEPTAYIAPTLVGLSGAVGVIRYVLPDIVRNLKTKHITKEKMRSIVVDG